MIKVFEMFAGYGGASFALKKANIDFECVGFSEIYEPAINIFKLNHGNIKNYGNCTKINPEELPDFDLLTGGFPCQPFSVNTNHNARGEKHKSYDLFHDILRIIKHKRPKYIVLENVKGILGEKAKDVYTSLCTVLKILGYDLKIKVLNSKEHNTPQNRERVFFIGKLGSWGKKEFEFPEKEKLSISVKSILGKNVERRIPRIKNYKLNKECNIEKFGKISRLDAILKSPVNKRNSNVAFEILDVPSNCVSRQSDRIYYPTHSPCITATGRDYIFYVDGEIIVLTPRECFRLMGFFNDEIKLEGLTDSQKHNLAGNGWDINLVSKIFSSLFHGDKKNDTK